MSPTRSGYKELGLDLVESLQDQPRKPRRPPMGEEKKDEGAGYPIKMLLEEALEKQRNTMKYINTHKHRDAVEIRLHFINNK
jgi:hypothetical protein